MDRRQRRRRRPERQRLGLKIKEEVLRQHIPETKPQDRTPKARLYFLRTKASIEKLVVGTSVIVGLVIGYFSLRPDVPIEPSLQLDPNNPFSTEFIITNNGPLSLHDLTCICGIRYFKYSNDTFAQDSFTRRNQIIEKLEPKGKIAFECPALMQNKCQSYPSSNRDNRIVQATILAPPTGEIFYFLWDEGFRW